MSYLSYLYAYIYRLSIIKIQYLRNKEKILRSFSRKERNLKVNYKKQEFCPVSNISSSATLDLRRQWSKSLQSSELKWLSILNFILNWTIKDKGGKAIFRNWKILHFTLVSNTILKLLPTWGYFSSSSMSPPGPGT